MENRDAGLADNLEIARSFLTAMNQGEVTQLARFTDIDILLMLSTSCSQ
jgi:hypothetical protein